MGIESDQLVYDYLSRVGDLAQQRHLPASDRMRLVSGLRNEIDRRRATHGETSPAAVRTILGSLGTPDEVVDRAAPFPSPFPPPSPASASPDGAPFPKPRAGDGPGRDPEEDAAGDAAGGRGRGPGKGAGRPGPGRSGEDRPERGGLLRFGRRRRSGASGKKVPGPGASVSAETRNAPPTDSAASAGLGADGLAGPGADRDWWETDAADGLPGFSGGVERPDLFTPPEPEEDEEEPAEPAPDGRRRLARVLRPRRKDAASAPGTEAAPEAVDGPAGRSVLRLGSPFVVLAALLLLGGAAFGSLLALAAGWLLAYASRRLTPAEVKGAVLVLPGLAVTAGAVWLWGRVGGRWGAAVAPGGEALGAALSETWPWTLRGAAVASGLFLLWRARRY
ncbi:hypothetical protein [Streptomyces sp. NPDC059491]|uniref:hypothetical protein n=1 Tax=Streptomyces sp. NPDC059491 TaxID=3346850 RepID=UPI00367C63A1